MTGRLEVQERSRTPDPLTRHAFLLDDERELRFVDSRKFGKMWLAADRSEVLPALSPEPLEADFTTELLAASLAGRNAPVKALLLEQSVAGRAGQPVHRRVVVPGLEYTRNAPPPGFRRTRWCGSAAPSFRR